MDNKELQKKVWTNLEKSQKKAAKFEDTVAVSFSLISEANEDLYVAVVDGKLSVEPYHYDAFGCEIEASADTINKMFAGELAFDKALKDGLAVVKGGDAAKFKALECLVPSKKTAAKKTTAKTAAKKTAAKSTEKKAAAPKAAVKAAAKPAAKAEDKKVAPAVKAAEKKTTAATAAKPEEKKATAPVKPVEKKPTAAVKPAVKK